MQLPRSTLCSPVVKVQAAFCTCTYPTSWVLTLQPCFNEASLLYLCLSNYLGEHSATLLLKKAAFCTFTYPTTWEHTMQLCWSRMLPPVPLLIQLPGSTLCSLIAEEGSLLYLCLLNYLGAHSATLLLKKAASWASLVHCRISWYCGLTWPKLGKKKNRSVCWLVWWFSICLNFLKGREVTLQTLLSEHVLFLESLLCT